MPTETDRGVRRLDHPCWTIMLADGRAAGFEESEPHFLTEEEAGKAVPDYQREDEPPVQVTQLNTHCWVATLLCGEQYVDETDEPAMHFADEASLLTSIAERGLFCVEPGVFTCDNDGCATCLPYAIPRLHLHLADKAVELGELALKFGRTERGTFHPDGLRPETDTDHAVMLSLVACALASEFFPRLDVGLVAQFCTVRDLPEVHAGDTRTLRLNGLRETAEKEQRERAATMKIHVDFHDPFPWVAYTIRRYELQDTAEAVFVRIVDKIMPKVCHILNGGVSVRAQNMTAAVLAERYEVQRDQIRGWAEKFPIDLNMDMLLAIYDILVGRELDIVKAAEQ